MKRITYSVPGNMIIFGEYYITEQGSSALCCAVDMRAHLTIDFFSGHEVDTHSNTSTKILLECIYNNESVWWKSPEDCDLFDIAQKLYVEYGDKFLFSSDDCISLDLDIDSVKFTDGQNSLVQVVVDTNSFYCKKDNGKTEKLGLGSSETSAILFSVLVLVLQYRNPLSNIQALAQYASHVHYMWQGNKGSGYGVYTSIYGGMGLFHQATDSEPPHWETMDIPLGIYWHYKKGQKSTVSKNAIVSFQNWKKQHTSEYIACKKEVSTHMAQVYTVFKDKHAMCTWLNEAKEIGVRLGQYIDIDARLHHDDSEYRILWKATGAGNESAIGISLQDYRECMDVSRGIFPIGIDEGLKRDE